MKNGLYRGFESVGCGGMTCVGFGDDLGALRGGGCGMGLKRRMKGGAKKW